MPGTFRGWPASLACPLRRPQPRFLVLVLQQVELPIDAAGGQQLLVRAGFAQLAFVQYGDAAGALDGRQAVRDDDRSAPLHHAVERVADLEFGLRVDARRGLVENQIARLARQRASEAHELLLRPGKTRAALAHLEIGRASCRE